MEFAHCDGLKWSSKVADALPSGFDGALVNFFQNCVQLGDDLFDGVLVDAGFGQRPMPLLPWRSVATVY